MDIGATGDFPDGKIDETDEGGLRLAVASDQENHLVRIEFGKPVAWIGLSPGDAKALAGMLLKKATEAMVLCNHGRPPIKVRHEDLMPADDSLFRSECPVCGEGVLLVRRDQETLELLREDHCVVCGQHFVYEEIPKGRRGR